MGAILGNSAGRRVAELYRQVIELFYAHGDEHSPRYLITIGHSHFVIEMDGDVPHYHALRSYAALLKHLGKTGRIHQQMVFDERSLKDSFLSLIYTRNKPGMVQFFYHAKAAQVEIYVLDERGALFTQQSIFYDSATLLNQFSRFFEAIANRINFMQENKLGTRRIRGVEFYEMSSDALGRKDLQRVGPSYGSSERFLSLQVIVEQLEPDQSAFTLYCDNQEFSSLEYGKGLFAAVNEHVFKRRSSGQSYPVYITDISLDSAAIGEEQLDVLQTSHFLAYKRRIEDQLNQ
jgi:adenylate cyclase class 1